MKQDDNLPGQVWQGIGNAPGQALPGPNYLQGGSYSLPVLTKREYFAVHSCVRMQDAFAYYGENEVTYEQLLRTVAKMQVAYADALIAALAEVKP